MDIEPERLRHYFIDAIIVNLQLIIASSVLTHNNWILVFIVFMVMACLGLIISYLWDKYKGAGF